MSKKRKKYQYWQIKYKDGVVDIVRVYDVILVADVIEAHWGSIESVVQLPDDLDWLFP